MGISAINVKKRYLCVCVLVVRCIYIAGVNLQEVLFKVTIALKVFFYRFKYFISTNRNCLENTLLNNKWSFIRGTR